MNIAKSIRTLIWKDISETAASAYDKAKPWQMERYSERRDTVYYVIFGELKFLDSYTT